MTLEPLLGSTALHRADVSWDTSSELSERPRSGVATRWSHWLGIGAIGLVAASLQAELGHGEERREGQADGSQHCRRHDLQHRGVRCESVVVVQGGTCGYLGAKGTYGCKDMSRTK